MTPARREFQILTRLAWPAVVAQMGLVAMGVVDLMVVGSLGEIPLAAVGLGNTWTFAGLVVALGTASGLDAFITVAYGADRPREAGRAALNGGVVLLAVGALLAIQHAAAAPALTLLMQPADAIPDAALYSRISIVGILPLLGFSLTRQLLQGGGLMRPAMWVVLVGNVVNAVANLTLVHGLGLGIAGCAWATVGVRWFMFAGLLFTGRHIVRASWPAGWRPSLAPILEVATRTLPVGMQVGFEVWAFNAASLLAGTLGTTAVAAHTTALSLTSMAFMIPLGVGQAAATRVGNHVGAGRSWTMSAGVAIVTGALVMSLSGVSFLVFPGPLARLYTSDPEVLTLVATVLPVAAAFGLFDGTQAVAMGVLRGLGDTRWPAIIALVAHWMIGLPIGWYGLSTLGLRSVWYGLCVGLAVASVLLVARVRVHGRGL